MSPFLEVRGLVSGYEGSRVLDGVDLDLAEGEALAVLGRNGVGKTTFISTLVGLVRPDEGSVRLGGQELAGRPTHAIARAGVGLVPQGRRVFAPLTVREHLTVAERSGADGRWTREAVLELLPRLGERLDNRGHQLSGGEQQMLAIARALLTNPRLLLLDEPSEGLAPAVTLQLGEVLRELAGGGISVVLVEQDLHLALSVADAVAVMEKGRVALRASVDEFRAEPERARTLLGVG